MLAIPRAQNKKVIAGASVIMCLWLLHMFWPTSMSLMSPSVVYVDSKSGQVLHNYDPESQVLLPEDQAHSVAAGSGKLDLKTPETERKPIKDTADEEKAAIQQITAAESKIETSKPGEGLIPGPRAKATFVSLARNSELYQLVTAIRHVEDRFNRKFKYDWVFLNDEPFTDEFKRVTSSIVSGKAKFGLVPKEHWSYPDWVDLEKAKKAREDMKNAKIIYGDSESYRHMCRFESGFFFRHPLMEEYDWYWRVEPGIKIHCDLDYDLFRFMEENNKVYGFTISIHEFVKTIPTLWQHTKDFINLHPEYVAENNFIDFISNDKGETYNLCHFWSNFEVASLKFLRSKAYLDYFEYLDKQGGFFYERWGDAPIHSIAVSLFLPKDKIHYFQDVGYNHGVYTQCPLNENFRVEHKCDCNPKTDFTFRGYSCGKRFYDAMGIEKPKEWVDYQ